MSDPVHFHRFGLLRLTDLNLYLNACVMHQIIHKTNPRPCVLVPVCGPRDAYDTRNKHLLTGKTKKYQLVSCLQGTADLERAR